MENLAEQIMSDLLKENSKVIILNNWKNDRSVRDIEKRFLSYPLIDLSGEEIELLGFEFSHRINGDDYAIYGNGSIVCAISETA